MNDIFVESRNKLFNKKQFVIGFRYHNMAFHFVQNT